MGWYYCPASRLASSLEDEDEANFSVVVPVVPKEELDSENFVTFRQCLEASENS
jgi:hypothetical protein